MAETIRDVVIRVAIQQTDTKLKAPDVTAATKAVDDFGKSVDTASKKAADSVAKIGDTVENVAVRTQEANAKIVDANLRAADSFKMAGEGAFIAARGVAFLALSSEEDLAKAIKTIALFQGAFDIFKGGTDIIKGTVEGFRALNTAAAATAAANTAVAVTNTAVATTGAAAATSMAALTIAMGPFALTAAAVVTAVVAIGVAWKFFSDDAPEAIKLTTEQIKEMNTAFSQAVAEATRFSAVLDKIAQTRTERSLSVVRSPQARLQLLQGAANRARLVRVVAGARDPRAVGDIPGEDVRGVSAEASERARASAAEFSSARALERERSRQANVQIQTAQTSLEAVATAQQRVASERKRIADEEKERQKLGRFERASRGPIDREGLEAARAELGGARFAAAGADPTAITPDTATIAALTARFAELKEAERRRGQSVETAVLELIKVTERREERAAELTRRVANIEDNSSL